MKAKKEKKNLVYCRLYGVPGRLLEEGMSLFRRMTEEQRQLYAQVELDWVKYHYAHSEGRAAANANRDMILDLGGEGKWWEWAFMYTDDNDDEIGEGEELLWTVTVEVPA